MSVDYEKNLVLETPNTLRFGSRTYKCATGKGGIKKNKFEGDGATPCGEFSLEKIFFRPDRILPPTGALPAQPLSPEMGWCDDPESLFYNQLVLLPFSGSHEKLWRDDFVYNLIIVVEYNMNPVVAGKGSAIFLHLARPDFSPTEGCIAFSLEDLLEISKNSSQHTRLIVRPSFNL